MNIKEIIRKHLGIILIVLVWVLMFLANYEKGTWLVGWDNTMPEFNYRASVAKTFTGIWQEYRGLGLLDGMAHAANMVHLGMIFLLDLILPKSVVRYVFIFLMNLLGGLGVYFLSRKLLRKESESNKEGLVGVVGALFYMFNIGVIQMFYIPLELFVIHFGFLPWLIIVLINLLKESSKKNVFWFSLVNLLAVSQAHVPSIFIVYGIVVFCNLCFWVGDNRKKLARKEIFNKIRLIVGLLLVINAFWGVPYFYATLFKAKEIVSAKINQMSNQEIILRNEAFGDLKSVAMLKGFNFNYFDLGENGVNMPLMNEWLIHFDKLGIEMISIGFFGIALIGMIFSIVNKRKDFYPFVAVFIFSFLMLGSKIPALSVFSWALKNYVPFFAEVFRFAFTKFIIVYVFSMSLLLVYGINQILSYDISLNKKYFKNLFLSLIIFMLGIYTFPVFKGQFLYNRLRREIPNEYFELFEYFRNIEKSKRVAVLPSPNYWGWTHNDWGYRGSGFIWYGIEQAMMDRAFDPWSQYNEQYYWELSYAINNQDIDLLNNVMKKYDIDYLIYDKSIVDTINEKGLSDEKMIELISDIEGMGLVRDLGMIKIFEHRDEEIREKYVSLLASMPIIANNYTNTWKDEAYNSYGEYVLKMDSKENEEEDVIFLFPSLFTNKLQKDFEFEIVDDEDKISFSLDEIRDLGGDYFIDVPDILATETYLPAKVNWQVKDELVELHIKLLLPEIYLGDNLYKAETGWSGSLDKGRCSETCYLNINYIDKVDMAMGNGEVQLLLRNKQDNVIGLYDGENLSMDDFVMISLERDLGVNYIKAESEESKFKLVVDKINNKNYGLGDLDLSKYVSEARSCRNNNYDIFEKQEEIFDGEVEFSYKARNNSSCDHLFIDNLDHRQGYVMRIRTENISSMPFKFGVQNPFLSRSEIDTLLSESKQLYNNWIVIPKTGDFFKGYTLFLDTVSFGREINENKLSEIEINWLPYNFLKQIRLIRKDFEIIENGYLDNFEVNKKAVWLYKIGIKNGSFFWQKRDWDDVVILKLSQAYDRGWKALYFDGLKPVFLSQVKVNNWANGWEVNKGMSDNIYVVFWPQILEYIGFGILVGLGVWMMRKRKY